MKQTTEHMLKKPWVVTLLALLCCALWGSAFPCIKVGYRLFEIAGQDSMSQILFAGIRFTIAGALTILIGSVLNGKLLKPTKGHWHMVINLSLTQTVIHYMLFYIGLAHTTGSKSSIIDASGVFFTVLVAGLLFHLESVKPMKLIGCLVGFAGVVLINVNGAEMDFSMSFLGEGFILLCALVGAFASVLLKAYSKEELPVTLSGYQFMAGGAVMAVGGYLLGGRLTVVTAEGIGLLLYLAMVSAVAFSIWGMLLKYNPASKVVVYGFSKPIWGVLLSAILLQEHQAFGVTGLVSLALVCVGIFCVNHFS